MDEIQRILVKEGRKDLAQKYFKKVTKVDKNKISLSAVRSLFKNVNPFKISTDIENLIIDLINSDRRYKKLSEDEKSDLLTKISKDIGLYFIDAITDNAINNRASYFKQAYDFSTGKL